jgi:hypothetical protein
MLRKAFNKAKELGSKGLHEAQRKTAVDVLNKTQNKVSGKSKDVLDKARVLVVNKYKDGGMIGTNVHILDKNSLMYKKSGVIVGEVGTSWLVETTERKGLVNKKKVEVIKSDKMKTGGSVPDDKYVAVHVSKDGYWTIASRPTYKGMAVLFKGSEPKNETFKVVTLEEALNHKKVVGKEYLMKNGGGVGENEYDILTSRAYELADMLDGLNPASHKYKVLSQEMEEVKDRLDEIEEEDDDKMSEGGATKGFNYSIGGL